MKTINYARFKLGEKATRNVKNRDESGGFQLSQKNL